MTPGGRLVEWAALRTWVTWLHDRYELGVEERLPHCWASHPGLIEELYALKVWRQEIYQSAEPSAQAARYWHAELRNVLQAAMSTYAAGCRTGHRAKPAPAAADRDLQKQWSAASPTAGIPRTEITAGQQARQRGDTWLTHPQMAVSLDTGYARPFAPGIPDVLFLDGTWWVPAAAGWLQVADPGDAARLNTSFPDPDNTTTRGS
jgi:hypothetical protein